MNNNFLFMSEVICHLFSRVTKSWVKIIGKPRHEWPKKSLFTITNVLFYFLHAILCPEHTIPLKTIIDRSFRNCCQGWSFLMKHCDVTTVDLWRQVDATSWHCDVIFFDCSCMRKLAQRQTSLVNNNHEYRFITTRYSQLIVWEILLHNSRVSWQKGPTCHTYAWQIGPLWQDTFKLYSMGRHDALQYWDDTPDWNQVMTYLTPSDRNNSQRTFSNAFP